MALASSVFSQKLQPRPSFSCLIYKRYMFLLLIITAAARSLLPGVVAPKNEINGESDVEYDDFADEPHVQNGSLAFAESSTSK